MDQLRQEGHAVEPIDFPLNEYVLPTYYILATAEASANLSRFDGSGMVIAAKTLPILLRCIRRPEVKDCKEVQRRFYLVTFY